MFGDQRAVTPRLKRWVVGLRTTEGSLEANGPYITELRDALTWARERTDRVVVRPSWDQGTYYWPGLGPNPHEFPPLDESRA